jgi:hypothetical protein
MQGLAILWLKFFCAGGSNFLNFFFSQIFLIMEDGKNICAVEERGEEGERERERERGRGGGERRSV